MIWAIGLWVVILIFGLYQIPIKENELKISGEKIPFWFSSIVIIFGLSCLGFIPLILNIFLQGLISFGYVEYGSAVGSWITLIGSGILYALVYNIYTNRLEKYKNEMLND